MERNEVLEAQARELMNKYGKGSVQKGGNGKKPCVQFFFDDVDGKKKRKSINIPEGKTAEGVKLEFFVELLKKYGEQGGFDFEDANSDRQVLLIITALKAMDERKLSFVLGSLDNIRFNVKGSCKKSFREVTEEFLEECRMNGVAYYSRYVYSLYIKSMNQKIGDMMIRDLDRDVSQNLLYTIKKRNGDSYNKDSVKNIKSLFERIICYAGDKGYIENKNDILNGLKMPINLKECNSENRFYKWEELGLILFKLDGHALYYTIMAVAACTGMRREEILGLSFEDVDFNRKRIYVKKAVIPADKSQNNGCRYAIGTTKTKFSVRCVPMCDFVADVIRSWIDFAEKDGRYEKTKRLENEGLLFVDDEGHIFRLDSISTCMKIYLKRRDVDLGEGRIIHAMRHTFANQLRRMGLDEVAVKQIGGWTNKAGGAFEKHYLKLYEEDDLIELALPYVEKYGKMVFNYMVAAGTGIPVERIGKIDCESLDSF